MPALVTFTPARLPSTRGSIKSLARGSRAFAATRSGAPRTALATRCGIELFGTQGSRSPLVNWYLYEIGQGFTMKQPRDPANPHPFGQVPALLDGEVGVFESGAILMYLADKYGGLDTPEKRAAVSPWLVWANASLDPCVFIEDNGRVIDTGARKPAGSVRALDRLEAVLEGREWILDEFSVADVAVASYLLYVPQFFRDVSMGKWPNITAYMLRCAKRDAYGKAYRQEQPGLVAKIEGWSEGGGGGNPLKDMLKKFT